MTFPKQRVSLAPKVWFESNLNWYIDFSFKWEELRRHSDCTVFFVLWQKRNLAHYHDENNFFWFFCTLLGFPPWKPLSATGPLGPCVLSIPGKVLLQERGWERTEKERAHPFLGYNSRAERSLGLNSAALKRCQINFLPVGTMTTSGNGIDLKGNKQGNCIFYCQCINLIIWNMNSFSAVALGSLCVHVQVPGTWEALFLVPAEEGREQDDFPVGVLVGDPSWPLGSTGDVKFTSTGSHIHERRRCLQSRCSCLSYKTFIQGFCP